MTGLLSLPPELLQEIGTKTAWADRTLRLICKQINFALEPRILSTIALSSISQLEHLVAAEPKPSPIAKYATQLNIYLYCLFNEDKGLTSEEEAKIKLLLVPAIASLTGVRKVLGLLTSDSDTDPEWAVLQVFDALASLPFLNDLHLCCWPVSNSSLRRLPHLENLTITRESQ